MVGQRCRALVELLDLYPTLAELCALPVPEAVEGRSLVPLLEDPDKNFRRAALTQAPRPNYLRGTLPEVMGYSIRTELHRYTEWRDFETGTVLARELYDHTADPEETANLANQPDQDSTLSLLADELNNVLTND